MRLTKTRSVILAAVVGVGAVGVVLGAVATSGAMSKEGAGPPAADGGRGSMMGGAAMMGGEPGSVSGGVTLLAGRRMEALAAEAVRSAVVTGGTITYASTEVDLVVLGAPGNRPGMFWQVDGLVNPTVVVPAGASITVHFADDDPGHSHGFEVTTAAPPFPKMAMMASRVAAPGALIMPVPAPRGGSWYGATIRFRAPRPDVYHYLCPVPGHARQGMWGTLTVR